MTRTRISLTSLTAAACLLGAAAPAFAQAPAPAPMYAPAPMMAPPPPAMAPAAGDPSAVMPAAPVVVPRAPDDMTGSVGFGVGINAGTTTLITPSTTNLMMKYWMSDSMALVPRLVLSINKASGGGDTAWTFAPEVTAQFVLLKGASTRLTGGAGLGLAFAKGQAPAATTSTDTFIGIYVPVQLGVEHFFTRWFSMGIGTSFDFLNYQKQGDGWNLGIDLDNVTYMGSLFFYTD